MKVKSDEKVNYGSLPEPRLKTAWITGIKKLKYACTIMRPCETYEYFRAFQTQDEFVTVMYLTAKNQILDVRIEGAGTVNESRIYLRRIIRSAMELNAVSIIISHNHPSGSVIPSESDLELTAKISHFLQPFDVTLLDHVIVSGENYLSLQESGYFTETETRRRILRSFSE